MNFMTISLVRSKNSKLPFLFTFLIVIILAFTSCVKSPNKIGAEIMPENSKLKADWTDTTTVYAFAEIIDSVRSDELSYNYLGSIVDPVFGSTIAGIYTEFSLSSLNHDFGPNPQVDSLILQFAYRGYYGDTNSTLIAHAYEMAENIELTSEYFSNLILQQYPEDYLNYSFLPKPNDSTQVIDTVAGDTNMFGAIQKFNLSLYNPGLANKLISVTPEDSIMYKPSNFREFFKGLYIITEPKDENGILLRFSLADGGSGLVMYYKNDTADSLKYGYPTLTTPKVNRYEHNYFAAETDFKNQVVNGDTLLGINKFYVQGLGGIRSVIKFPTLREWSRKGNYAINEAKLIFTGLEEEPYNGAPAALLLVKANEDGTQEILEDQYEGETFFGGVYESASREYVFRITNHLQKLIADTSLTDYGLYVYTNASSINPKRFVFNGNESLNDTIKPFRLEMVVSDLN